MIYDVVMFFVEKGSQIKEFVDSVLDSIESIVGGGVGAVARHIENTLAKILPLLLGFLASLLGLGGISEKIKEILRKVQEPVEKAVDFVINGALKLARPIINLVKRGAAWVKGKYEKGKAWVKGKVEAGKAWAKGKVEGAKARLTGDQRSPAEKQRDLDASLDAGHALLRGKMPLDKLRSRLLDLKARHRLTELRVVAVGDAAHVEGAVNPTGRRPDVASAGDTAAQIMALQGEIDALQKDIEARKTAIRGHAANPLLQVGAAHAAAAAVTSLPTSSHRVSTGNRRDIQPIGAAHGCHYPGCTNPGPYTPDHAPPSKLMALQIDGQPLFSGTIQRLFPHCRLHSNQQGQLAGTIVKLYKSMQDSMTKLATKQQDLQKLKGP
jgi:hypothetical protein